MRNRLDNKFVAIYCLISFFPDVIAFLWILLLGEYRQEFTYAKLKVTMPYENIVILFLCCLFVFASTLVFFIYFFQDKKFCISKNFQFVLNRRRFEYYLIIIMILNILLLATTGVGKAGGEYKSSALSSVLALLNYEFFFWIYFIEYSSNRDFKYYFICFIYILLQLLQGWSSFVLSFFFAILCMSNEKQQKKLLILLPFIFLGGGAIYTILYPFKNFIRFGKFIPLSYSEGLLALMERLTKFPNACVAIQNQNKIIDLYYSFNSKQTEVLSFFYPWVPGFLMPDKTGRIFNNLIMLSVYPSYSSTQSAGTGISYIYLLGKLSWVYPLILLLTYFLYFFIYKLLVDSLVTNKKYVNYLSFVVSFYFLRGFCMRQYGMFVPVLWTLIILLLFKCIKIKKINSL